MLLLNTIRSLLLLMCQSAQQHQFWLAQSFLQGWQRSQTCRWMTAPLAQWDVVCAWFLFGFVSTGVHGGVFAN